MFIDDKKYQTNLADINSLRYLLFTNFYNNMSYIQNLTEIISKNIECLGIDYSAFEYSFTIKIKKTAMRRMHLFKHKPDFYYQIIPAIFNEFIKNNEQEVLKALSTRYDNPYRVLQYLYETPGFLANLCHLTCIDDNIIIIKL